MRVVHAIWTGGALHLWGESADAAQAEGKPADAGAAAHPGALAPGDLAATLRHRLPRLAAALDRAEPAGVDLRLPTAAGAPVPSERLVHARGGAEWSEEAPTLELWRVATLSFRPAEALPVLESLEDQADDQRARLAAERDDDPDPELLIADSVRFFAAAARLARSFIAQQRVTPMLRQLGEGSVEAYWMPWWSDAAASEQAATLAASAPPAVRAADDEARHAVWPIVESFLSAAVDALCRRALGDEDVEEAIEDRDPAEDDHVAWLTGLLGHSPATRIDPARASIMLGAVRRWIGLLDDRGEHVGWRLHLRLIEPEPDEGEGDDMLLDTRQSTWTLALGLQSEGEDAVVLDAADLWSMPADVATVDGRRIEDPPRTLLSEIGRAARIFAPLERALEEPQPTEIELSTAESHRFLTEFAPALREQGFGVADPRWWGGAGAQLGLLLDIETEDAPPAGAAAREGGDGAEAPVFGLHALVDYRWRIAVGSRTLTIEEFERLASSRSPLVKVGGQWVEIKKEKLAAVRKFFDESGEGSMTLGDAMRLAYGSDEDEIGAKILGVRATGWAGELIGDESDGLDADRSIVMLEQPGALKGDLRNYQLSGLSWLAFLDRLGLGGCLADDMGLGKTIQLISLMLHERTDGARPAPTLVIAPTSVVGNWRNESRKFAPHLETFVHHGPERLTGEAFAERAKDSDLVITTYALAHRDFETLATVHWRRVCLDEAQNIKNPSSKQSQAVRGLPADRRVALTGTPVENRLTELWSIMEFLNPGYLGSAARFRKKFSLPVERRRDTQRTRQLRQLVQPFVLRRLKTDPVVVPDLPKKVETKELAHLTPEQSALYEQAVGEMLGEVERAEGVRRRGIVLATLIKLKQICNHPSQLVKDWTPQSGRPPKAARSGKATRLIQMLDEVLAAEEQALVFTQFRQMGELLAAMLRHDLDRDVLLLHGGTPQAVREQMIERFQKGDGSAPIFILSLKAGGVGMNLTAASHVFHYDRWWNPAVENQATDRAHRIGQDKTVHVHKFLVAGTLEERIDEMLEQKLELAETIIGSGEEWLTELSTTELREMLRLRPADIEEAVA